MSERNTEKHRLLLWPSNNRGTSTYGAAVAKARHLQKAVIRLAMTYSAVWHAPKELRGRPQSVVQNNRLQMVSGARRLTNKTT